MSLVILALLFGLSPIVQAQERPQTVDPLYVEWYNAEVLRSVKKNRARVRLPGQTKPGTKITIAGGKIVFITKSEKIVSVSAGRVWTENMALADERGVFEIDMDLPFATAQIPFKVTSPKGQVQNYQLSIVVDRNDVKIETGQAKVKSSPYLRRKWGVWGGLGANFLKYDQSISSSNSGVGFQSLTSPSLFTKISRSINRDWAAQMTANYSPGKTSSSSAVQVKEGEYAWTFLTGEMTYFPPNWKFTQKTTNLIEIGMQGGLQYHSIPFIMRSSATNSAEASVKTNDILMMDVGATAIMHRGRYWLLETFLRYQYPVSSGSLYDLEPKVAFDGSVGVIYKWKPNWRIGAFWYGQFHQYEFKNAPDKFSGANISGSQDLFFSNLEFRIGYEFD